MLPLILSNCEKILHTGNRHFINSKNNFWEEEVERNFLSRNTFFSNILKPKSNRFPYDTKSSKQFTQKSYFIA